MPKLIETTTHAIESLLPDLEAIYKDLHQHPELSMQEIRTAGIAADYVEKLGYDVTRNVGNTGVVAILHNGEGPTVMLRADMDALPMEEATGLPYASTARSKDEDGVDVAVAHSCGHDMHVTWLMGVAHLMAAHRDSWRGTLMAVFQPGEEVARGARSMINDDETSARVRNAFESYFGERAYETAPAVASEDFSVFGREWGVPYAFWFVYGTDPDTFRKAVESKKLNEIPSNHSPKFAPVLDPTLRTGLEAMLCAAGAWLDQRDPSA